MGAYSPAPVLTEAMIKRVLAEIVRPTVAALARRGIAYRGVLYAGLMITTDGPKLIEYNARFGDPECQVLMMRLEDDLLAILSSAADGAFDRAAVRWRDEAALAVVIAANGYPGEYARGTEIRGLADAASLPGSKSSTPEQRGMASASSLPGGAFSMSPPWAGPSPKRSRAPTKPSGGSTGREVFTAAISAIGRSSRSIWKPFRAAINLFYQV
jgi:hypothetical protein